MGGGTQQGAEIHDDGAACTDLSPYERSPEDATDDEAEWVLTKTDTAATRNQKRYEIDLLIRQEGAPPESLLPFLEGDDSLVQHWAIDALLSLGTAHAVATAWSRLESEHCTLRIEAIEAAARHGVVVAIPNIIWSLEHDKVSLVRVCAAEALGDLEVTNAAVVAVLLRALHEDRGTLVRAYAADALARLGVPEAEREIRRRLARERNTRARASMLVALLRLGDAEALKRLLRMLKRVHNWGIQTAIISLLSELTSPNIDRLFCRASKS